MMIRSIKIAEIRHNDLDFYVSEGFGGQTLEKWPVVTFFRLYVSGNKTEAQTKFCAWYEDQLEKSADIANDKGGMYKGSLYRLIESNTGKDFLSTTKDERLQSIQERVQQRFTFLQSVIDNGYDADMGDQIRAIFKNGAYYLQGGHHRAAALLVLGNDCVPNVLVFPNQFIYNVFSCLRNIKNYATFQN